jgi:5-hydroxyisourate hydrolase
MSSTSPITTHILDTALGKPAAGVSVTLSQQAPDQAWETLGRGVTNADGRVTDLLPPEPRLPSGIYCVHFAVAEYFEGQGQASFYPEVEIRFHLAHPEQHYHIPLLLSPFGFTTYRGS